MGTFTWTAQFLMCTATINPWQILNFFQQLIFSVVVSCAVVMELFFGVSAFFFSYRLFQLAHAQGNRLSVMDVARALLRKFLRIAPIYYAVFLIGWGMYPEMAAGPIWYKGSLMFETCRSDWWAVLLMSGNLYPYFTAPNEGCFYWGWIIDVDF